MILINGNEIRTYVSTEQTITAAGALTLAHGLGKSPFMVQCFIKCLTAELNYSVGDVLMVDFSNPFIDANQGVSVTYDSTNIYIRFGSKATTFYILDKTSGASSVTTNASWSFIVKAVVGDRYGLMKFTSTEQTITAAGALTLAHGLGKSPFMVQCFIEAQAGGDGYGAGDILMVDFTGYFANMGFSLTYDSTNIYIRFGSRADTTIYAINKTTGGGTTLTNANWKLIVHAWTT